MTTLPDAGTTTYRGDVLDRAGVRSVGAELPGGAETVLDLAAVTLPTAGGLGELVALHGRLRDEGRRLVLANLNARTLEAVAIAGLADTFEVRPVPSDQPPARSS